MLNRTHVYVFKLLPIVQIKEVILVKENKINHNATPEHVSQVIIKKMNQMLIGEFMEYEVIVEEDAHKNGEEDAQKSEKGNTC